MRYEPLTNEQIDDLNPKFTFGLCRFRVIAAEEKLSSKKNPMINLTLLVKDGAGVERRVFDHLVATPKSTFKIKQFCEQTGVEYDGHLTDRGCLNKEGHCITAKDGDYVKITSYNTKNVKIEEKFEDDDITF